MKRLKFGDDVSAGRKNSKYCYKKKFKLADLYTESATSSLKQLFECGGNPGLAFCSLCRSRKGFFLTVVRLFPFISISYWLLPVPPPLPSMHMPSSGCHCLCFRGAVWEYSFPVGYFLSAPYNRQPRKEGNLSSLFSSVLKCGEASGDLSQALCILQLSFEWPCGAVHKL